MIYLAIKDADKILLTVLIKKFGYWNVLYLAAGREKILEWYNLESNRGVCIRTLDYMIARLKGAEMIGRTSRTTDKDVVGRRFTTSLTFILKQGFDILTWMGVAPYNIINRIKASPRPRKERVRKDKALRTRVGSTSRLGKVIKEMIVRPDEE